MTTPTHDITGLKNNPLRIEDGDIRLSLNNHQIDFMICTYDELTNFPAFSGGTFTDENGIEIDIERFINNLTLDPHETHRIKTAAGKDDPDDKWSQRMNRFFAILENRLEGRIPTYEDSH